MSFIVGFAIGSYLIHLFLNRGVRPIVFLISGIAAGALLTYLIGGW